MFTDMHTYIALPKSDRQKHIDLTEACIEIGGDSVQFRGLLAHYLRTTIPSDMEAVCCHACGNGKCSNPKHLYWGTFSENMIDDYAHGKRKSIHERMKEKLGNDGHKEWHRSIAAKGGRKSTPRRLSDERIIEIRALYETQDQTKWGWLNAFAESLGVSHTQARRLIKKYCTGV